MKQEKLIKIAKVLDSIIHFIRTVGVILAVMSSVIVGCMLLLTLFGANSIFDYLHYAFFDFGSLSLTLTEEMMYTTKMSKYLFFGEAILAIIVSYLYVYELGLWLEVLEPMKEGRPFETQVSVNIKKIANLTLLSGFISEAGATLIENLTLKEYDISAILNMDNITSYTYSASIELTFLTNAVVLYLVYYIFKYGEMLQTESDETL